MSRRYAAALALVAAAGLAVTGCQSTQDKAKIVQAEAAERIASQVPLAIPKPTKDVTVVDTTVLSDENGGAVAVEVKNNTKEMLLGLPILVDVRDANGKRLFINDAFGTEFALNHIPLMKPGETVVWVNDQILTSGEPKTVKVTVGAATVPVPAQLPEIVVGQPRLRPDPSGILAQGTATNQSQIDQKDLVMFAVAKRGGTIVAAGRGGFKNLKADKTAPYNIYFIGDPSGADVEITAPPSVFG